MKFIQHGITLLELMVAVAILGIVTAITLPNFGPMLEADRANNFIDEFSRTVKYARATASSADEFVVVCPVADPSTGGTCSADWQNNPIVAFVDRGQDLSLNVSDDLVLRAMSLPSDNDTIKQSKGSTAITIDGQGRVNEEHQFVICPNGNNDSSSALQVSMSGNTWKLGTNVLTCGSV